MKVVSQVRDDIIITMPSGPRIFGCIESVKTENPAEPPLPLTRLISTTGNVLLYNSG